jgi:hypothetical protein
MRLAFIVILAVMATLSFDFYLFLVGGVAWHGVKEGRPIGYAFAAMMIVSAIVSLAKSFG